MDYTLALKRPIFFRSNVLSKRSNVLRRYILVHKEEQQRNLTKSLRSLISQLISNNKHLKVTFA